MTLVADRPALRAVPFTARPAWLAADFVRSSASAAQASSVPRMAKPTATTRTPGPGRTSMASPAHTKTAPMTETAIRFELRRTNVSTSDGRVAMCPRTAHPAQRLLAGCPSRPMTAPAACTPDAERLGQCLHLGTTAASVHGVRRDSPGVVLLRLRHGRSGDHLLTRSAHKEPRAARRSRQRRRYSSKWTRTLSGSRSVRPSRWYVGIHHRPGSGMPSSATRRSQKT